MRIKKLVLFSFFALSMLIPNVANAEVISESGETYGLESVDKKINDKMKNLETSPTFNISIVKESSNLNSDMKKKFKDDVYSDNSILLGFSEKDNTAVIIVGESLSKKDVLSEGLINQMYSEYGLNKLKVGEVFDGLEELSDSIYYQMSLSSIGNNTYDYKAEQNAIEQEKLKKENEKKSKETSSKMFIYVGVSIAVLALIIIFLSNKNSFVSKMIFKNKKDKQLNVLLEESELLLNDSKFQKQTGIDYLSKQFSSFDLSDVYNKLVKKDINNYLTSIKLILEQKELGELEILKIQPLLVSMIDKNKDKLNLIRYKTIANSLVKKYPDTPESIFRTVEFEHIIKREDFSKEQTVNYLKEKSNEFYKVLDSRYSIFDKKLDYILENIKFDLNDSELSSVNKLREVVLTDYHKDITLSDSEVEKKYENNIYHKLSNIRLSKLNETKEVKEYLKSKISDYDLTMATDKILDRQISKFKLLM